MTTFSIVNQLSTADKRALIAELRDSIAFDKRAARIAKVDAKLAKQAERDAKKASRIAALEAKLAALKNPVGTKAIKANRKAGAVTVTKYA
jgi:hypothetical protein